MIECIGIHSSARPDDSLVSGHAWLSLHFTNGRQTTVGLWTTTLFETKRFVKDPTGAFLDESFDVNFGKEVGPFYRAKSSRYYKLSSAQSKRAIAVLGTFVGWRFTNTCASWATRVIRELLGEDLDASELLGATDTPRALSTVLNQLEKTDPTFPELPKQIQGNPVVKGSLGR